MLNNALKYWKSDAKRPKMTQNAEQWWFNIIPKKMSNYSAIIHFSLIFGPQNEQDWDGRTQKRKKHCK